MKRILFIIIALVSFTAKSQVLGADMLNLDPRTTTQRDAITIAQGLIDGSIILNTTTGGLERYNGSAWISLGGSGGITELSEDLSPVLSANLDAGTNTITNVDNIDFNIANVTTAVEWSNMNLSQIGLSGGGDWAMEPSVNANVNGLNWTNADETWRIGGDEIATVQMLVGAGTDDQTASEVPIIDTGANFTATDVEGALAELASSTVADGDKGDITVSASGATWNIDASAVGTTELGLNAVTSVKVQDGALTFLDMLNNNSSFAGAIPTYDNLGITWVDPATLGGGGGSDQSISPSVKTTFDTYDNLDVTLTGAVGSNRKWNKHITNDTIVLGSTITRYNQPWMETLTGADSLYIKKGTGAAFYIADSVNAIAADGLILKGGRKTATIIAELSNTFYINGEVSIHNEAAAGDPIDTMTGLVASWREDDLPAIGQPAGNWTDRVNGYVMVAKGSPTVTAYGGGKEVLYDGVDDGHANDVDDSDLDPVPQTDAFSYVVKFGSSWDFGESGIRKVDLTNSDYQYGLQNRGPDLRLRVGGITYTEAVTLAYGDIIAVSVTTSTITTYLNGNFIGTQTLTGSNIEPSVLSFGSSNGGTSGFENIGLRDVLFFNTAIDQAAVNTIQSNL